MIRLMPSQHRFSSNIKQPIFDRLLLSAVTREFISQIRILIHRDLNFGHSIVIKTVLADPINLIPGQTILHHVIRVDDWNRRSVFSNRKRSDLFDLLLLLLLLAFLLGAREHGVFALLREPSIQIRIFMFGIFHGT